MEPNDAEEPVKAKPYKQDEYKKMKAAWLATHQASDPVQAGMRFAEEWAPIERLMATVELLDTEGTMTARTYMLAEEKLKAEIGFRNGIIAALAITRGGRLKVSGKARAVAVAGQANIRIHEEVHEGNGHGGALPDLLIDLERSILGPTGAPMRVVR